MPTLPSTATSDDANSVVALITAQQALPQRSIIHVGTTDTGIRQELDALHPPWLDTVRLVRSGPKIVGACLVEWDDGGDRAWVVGPWLAGDDSTWIALAGPLLDAVLAQLPGDITDVELCGDVAHRCLADLASSRGMQAGPVNHAVTIRHAVPGTPLDNDTAIRDATDGDLEVIARLHDTEFPATHTSAGQLVSGDRDSRIALVADSAVHGVVGYAAGLVHADGEGFIDYVAVDPSARGHGVGRQLVATLTNRLLESSPSGQVSLTVEDRRSHARALYDSLGFEPDGSFIAYRTHPSKRRPAPAA